MSTVAEPSAPERLVVPLWRSVALGLLAVAGLLLVALSWLSAEERKLLVQQLKYVRPLALTSDPPLGPTLDPFSFPRQ